VGHLLHGQQPPPYSLFRMHENTGYRANSSFDFHMLCYATTNEE